MSSAMFIKGLNLLQIQNNIKLIRCVTNCKIKENIVDSINPATKRISLFIKLLGLNTKKCNEIFEKYPKLLTIHQNDLRNAIEILKSFNYTTEQICSKPGILCTSALTLRNRRTILQESGVVNISFSILSKYITVMNKEIVFLKSHGVIPFETNVPEKLISSFDEFKMNENDYSENIELKLLRRLILSLYLSKKLNASEADLKKLWKTYSRLQHRSYESIKRMIDILLKDLNFTKERILNNGFVLHGDPDNLLRMLNEIKTIGDENVKDILYRRPKIMMSTCDSIKQIIEHVRKFNIPETAINRCLEVLTLGSDTVHERLLDLNKIEEFQVLTSNPRVLRLIHYQNKARNRLDYLNQLKVKCASLHILSCSSDVFAKFAREGTDKTKGRDIIIFLSKMFNKTTIDVRRKLSRHPNWCHIPLVNVKQCFDFLLTKKFHPEDIYNNIHILIYPIKRIQEKLCILHNNEIFKELKMESDFTKITNNQILALCLYLIEVEFHFTGDGVWTEQQTQQVENFTSILPDFPESTLKVYKYGMKPSTKQNSESIT